MSRENWKSEKIFNRLLNNKTQKTFWDNIIELRKRPNKEVYNRAFELVKTANNKEKIIGIYVLAQLGFNPRFQQKKTVDIYYKLLENEKSPKVISAILSSISHNNETLNEKQISKLTEFKNHNYSEVRFQLVLALSGLENKKAIRTLIELSQDKKSDIRNWSTFGLGSQIEINNAEITKALWNRIDDKNQGTKFEAISGLAKRKDRRIKEILKEELKEIDEFGSLILESIEDFNDIEFIKLLETQIEINKTSKKINEEWLKSSLEKIKNNANHINNGK